MFPFEQVQGQPLSSTALPPGRLWAAPAWSINTQRSGQSAAVERVHLCAPWAIHFREICFVGNSFVDDLSQINWGASMSHRRHPRVPKRWARRSTTGPALMHFQESPCSSTWAAGLCDVAAGGRAGQAARFRQGHQEAAQRDNPGCDAVSDGMAIYAPVLLPCDQWTSGLENPATSFTRSAWRLEPVFANRRLKCVLTAVSATPSASPRRPREMPPLPV